MTLKVVEKKLKKSEGELSNKSTLAIGSEEQLRTCRKELEQMKMKQDWKNSVQNR